MTMRMMHTIQSLPQGVNKLLGALPAEEYRQILPKLELFALERRAILHRQGASIDTDYVYFLGDGMCSIGNTLEDGESVIIAIAGNEGVVGAPVLHSGGGGITTSIVQARCEIALRMPMEAFHEEIERRAVFRDAVNGYSEALVASIVQMAACNSVHKIESRLPCWLLMARDRLGREEIPLTHETLALMLGVRRPSVTLAANWLQASGLISYRRGMIRVMDANGLSSVSCECYRTIKATFDRLSYGIYGMEARRAAFRADTQRIRVPSISAALSSRADAG